MSRNHKLLQSNLLLHEPCINSKFVPWKQKEQKREEKDVSILLNIYLHELTLRGISELILKVGSYDITKEIESEIGKLSCFKVVS